MINASRLGTVSFLLMMLMAGYGWCDNAIITATLNRWSSVTDATYAVARDTDTGETGGETYIAVGQRESSGYQVLRGNIAFVMPEMDSLYACTIYLWGGTDESDDEFGIYILSAHDSSPVFDNADFSKFNGRTAESAHTGTILNDAYETTSFTAAAWDSLTFNAAGLDSMMVSSGDTLWVAIISDNDYDNIAPTEGHNEYVTFDSLDDEGHEPYILIQYAPADTGWTGTFMRVTNPSYIMNVLASDIKKVMGIE